MVQLLLVVTLIVITLLFAFSLKVYLMLSSICSRLDDDELNAIKLTRKLDDYCKKTESLESNFKLVIQEFRESKEKR
ncbi:MAG: hypothetical protein GWP10_15420 [Nitrospiraceae bacterium]|nr:hypothetical protein [Nitrospiraceae bacterium]